MRRIRSSCTLTWYNIRLICSNSDIYRITKSIWSISESILPFISILNIVIWILVSFSFSIMSNVELVKTYWHQSYWHYKYSIILVIYSRVNTQRNLIDSLIVPKCIIWVETLIVLCSSPRIFHHQTRYFLSIFLD